jgi:hypothetical protein
LSNYAVKTPFRDKDTLDLFGVGDEYYTDDPERAKFLQQEGYLGEEIVEEADEDSEEWPKHVGGGYYELPNGEKVKGKENAHKALADLEKDPDKESEQVPEKEPDEEDGE